MKSILLAAVFGLTVLPASAQQIVFTFDDLPAHGNLKRSAH